MSEDDATYEVAPPAGPPHDQVVPPPIRDPLQPRLDAMGASRQLWPVHDPSVVQLAEFTAGCQQRQAIALEFIATRLELMLNRIDRYLTEVLPHVAPALIAVGRSAELPVPDSRARRAAPKPRAKAKPARAPRAKAKPAAPRRGRPPGSKNKPKLKPANARAGAKGRRR